MVHEGERLVLGEGHRKAPGPSCRAKGIRLMGKNRVLAAGCGRMGCWPWSFRSRES